MKSWWLAARPKTLTAGVVPIVAATALVHAQDFKIHWWLVGLCLFSTLCIQIATNFINDAIDFAKGADGAERIGPVRATQSGLISGKNLMQVSWVLLLLAFLSGAPLVYFGGWPIVIVGLVSLFMAYSYTGGPLPLAYLGLGDLFVILFFGLIAIGGVYYLQTGEYTTAACILGLQIGLLATVLIAINNFRDIEQDIKANKRTLAVRFGARFARFEIAMLILVSYALQTYWFYQGKIFAALLPLLFLPLGLKIIYQVAKNAPSPIFNKYLGQSALLHVGFGVILSVGLYLG